MKYTISAPYHEATRLDLLRSLPAIMIRIADYVGLVSFIAAVVLSFRGICIFLGATDGNIMMKSFLSATDFLVNPFRNFFNYEITVVEVNTALAVATILTFNIIFQKTIRTLFKSKTLLRTGNKRVLA